MAPEFLKWLNASNDRSWLDVGCGTGALSEAIELNYMPQRLSCIDPSEGFIEKARKRILTDDIRVATVEQIPFENESFDYVVSGLALNFFPKLEDALLEMKRVAENRGRIAAYVWDYPGRMDFLRYFWDTALEVDQNSQSLDEGLRFPICNTDNLIAAFKKAELTDIECSELDIDTVFKNFEDFWNPFLGGQGPAPSYLASLSQDQQHRFKIRLQEKLPIASDGRIKLLARALAIQGQCLKN
jgi:SAM-dependent methyltransferase